eukprot:TRINITY_DN1950_c0_g1_i2.p1 TRINITY_DN1950_c0_g1~~TRINITY_DN1950_c0_g1_i2.p1  ORF type:complete len:545 (+),score=69.13 TRINITY_DN1950_c0_g1_i2:74-1708(+)
MCVLVSCIGMISSRMQCFARSIVICALLLLPYRTMGVAVHQLSRSRSLEKPLPHILFIIADDLGWHDVGFRNHGEINTPTIDKLAAEGHVLNHYYVFSTCSPTRASFLTGRTPIHHTLAAPLQITEPDGLPLDEVLLPEKLAEAGYRCHMVGKWHIGHASWMHTPTFRGFESFFGLYSGGADHFEHTYFDIFDFHRDDRPRCGRGCSKVAWDVRGKYSTHMMTEEAVAVIERHDSATPLFLWLAYQAVHWPGQVPERYLERYEGIADVDRRTLAGMMDCLDEGVANVTWALQQKAMLHDTVIIFTTDNGGALNPSPGLDFVGASNWPLRGGKHSVWEGGTRAVGVVWAGTNTGLISRTFEHWDVEVLMEATDWFPTLCALAGISDSCAELHLDGNDQSDFLFGSAPVVSAPNRYHYYGTHRFYWLDVAMRDSKGWKIVQDWAGEPSAWSPASAAPCPANQCLYSDIEPETPVLLFHLPTDPGEKQDVAAEHPDVVARMKAMLNWYHTNYSLRRNVIDLKCPEFSASSFVATEGRYLEPWCSQAE